MNKFTFIMLLGLVAFAAASPAETECGDGDEECKQFFAGAFRPFFMRPFPLSTNHYPTADTVPSAWDARSEGNEYLANLNLQRAKNDAHFRTAIIRRRQFSANPQVHYNGQKVPIYIDSDETPLLDYLAAPAIADLLYVEKSFTAKSDGFVMEWVAHDRKVTRAEGRSEDSIVTRGTDVVTMNLYGKIISVRRYSAGFQLMGGSNCPCIGSGDLDTSAHYTVKPVGTSCGLWDEKYNENDCTGEDTDPAWCADRWCYVDPNNCGVDNAPSGFFGGLTYSYATCGSTDQFAAAPARGL